MDFLVDPLVIALPQSTEHLDNYIRYLLQWRDELMSDDHNFMIAQSCAFALDEAEYAPYIPNLQALWQDGNIVDIDYKDVFKICASILSNTPHFEERIPKLHEVDQFSEEVEVRPDLLERQPDELTSAFQEALGFVAYARSFLPDSLAGDLLLLTYPIEGSSLAEISALFLVESPDESDYVQQAIEADITLVATPTELLELMEFSDFWEDTARAIRWKAHQLRRQDQLNPFMTHSTFNESIKNLDAHNYPSLLNRIFRQCVLLLCMEWTAIEAHELGKPQHTIHKWKSFRMYVNEGRGGWRLHYWRRGDEFYLIQVLDHDTTDIDVPSELYDENFEF